MPDNSTDPSAYDEASFTAVAKAALLELTPENTVGDLTGHIEEDGAITVTFAARMSGYPGWHWTVSVAQVEGSEPTALEVELMPGNGALLAPDWVPWSDRLAEYQAAQEQLESASADDESDDDDSDDDVDDESDEDDDNSDEDDDVDDSDDDADDLDDDDDPLGSDVLHGGDLDGVDIDGLDDSASDDDVDDDDDSDDDGDSDGDDSDDEDSDEDDPDAEDERSY